MDEWEESGFDGSRISLNPETMINQYQSISIMYEPTSFFTGPRPGEIPTCDGLHMCV